MYQFRIIGIAENSLNGVHWNIMAIFLWIDSILGYWRPDFRLHLHCNAKLEISVYFKRFFGNSVTCSNVVCLVSTMSFFYFISCNKDTDKLVSTKYTFLVLCQYVLYPCLRANVSFAHVKN